SLWSGVYEVFRVFQTQRGQSANFFNDTDLGIASGFENNIEFGLLFSSTCIVAATSWCASSYSYCGSCGNVEFIFKSLDELGQFKHRQFYESIQQFFG